MFPAGGIMLSTNINNTEVKNYLFFKTFGGHESFLCRDSSVGRASAWSHTVSSGMIAPSFESHQWVIGMWKRWLGCHAGCQEVGRCHTRCESQGMCNVTHTPLLSSNKAEPTLALKPRGDVTRSLKQAPQKGKKMIFFQQLGLLCEQTYPNTVIYTSIISGIFKIS